MVDLSGVTDMPKVKNRRNDVEMKFASQLTEAGIGGWEQNVRFIPGRRFEADFFWKDLRLVAEVDGGLYLPKGGHNGAGAEGDRVRDILAARHGIVTHRFATKHVANGFAIENILPLLQARAKEVGYAGKDIPGLEED